MQSSFYQKVGKRVFDICVSSVVLVLLTPLFLIISIMIKVGSKGRVFFIQKRVGKDFREFDLYKFRTMRDEEGLEITAKDDPRITKIGRFLRKTKIDELPQLLNVLKGDMSLVGPRPEVKKYVEIKKDEYQKILTVKPGITDLAAIEFSNEEEILANFADREKAYINEILPKKIELYLKYIENITFKNDISIMIKTIQKVFL